MDHFDKDIVLVRKQARFESTRSTFDETGRADKHCTQGQPHNRRKNAQVLTNIDLGVTVRRALCSTGSLTCPVVHVHGISRDLLELIRFASRLMAYMNAISEIEMKNAGNTPFVQGLRSRSCLISFSGFTIPPT